MGGQSLLKGAKVTQRTSKGRCWAPRRTQNDPKVAKVSPKETCGWPWTVTVVENSVPVSPKRTNTSKRVSSNLSS